MDTGLQLFHFNEQPVRIAVVNGEIWWIATDVCRVLEIVNVSQAVGRLAQKGVCLADTLTSGGSQKLTAVNEPNLYRLIFRSDKPQAKDFQDWVFEKVLPSIRKTGSYSVDQEVYHHINQDYYQRLKINRDFFNPGRFTSLEVLDNLSLKWGYDLFKLTEKCRPDISWGQAFMDCLRDAGYNTTIGKPDSEIIKVWHVVDVKTMLKKEVNSFPNKWYGFNLDCFGEIYVANHLPKYLRGKTPDGRPRMENPEAAIDDLQKKLAYTYQNRLF